MITNPPYVKEQEILHVDEFELESGFVLKEVPIAYKTWGKLNESRNNCMLICHAFSGTADVADWWSSMFGPGLCLDPEVFFIVCVNCLGSPYGTASPVTVNPETGLIYGPDFPLTTTKDDYRLSKLVLDHLKVKRIQILIGPSMGGLQALEWAYEKDYVESLVLMVTAARISGWILSWNETQRQSIYADPSYMDGYYDLSNPPRIGLGAARMAALLSYRSHYSFNSRFGRDYPSHEKANMTPVESNNHFQLHNEGNLGQKRRDSISSVSSIESKTKPKTLSDLRTQFSAQGYLRYQAKKFVDRFDANCYIALTRKLDSFDIARDRAESVEEALEMIKIPTLVLGIESDILFNMQEQIFMHENIPNSELIKIQSPDGHDGFLTEWAQVNRAILDFEERKLNLSTRKSHKLLTEKSINDYSEELKEDIVKDVTSW